LRLKLKSLGSDRLWKSRTQQVHEYRGIKNVALTTADSFRHNKRSRQTHRGRGESCAERGRLVRQLRKCLYGRGNWGQRLDRRGSEPELRGPGNQSYCSRESGPLERSGRQAACNSLRAASIFFGNGQKVRQRTPDISSKAAYDGRRKKNATNQSLTSSTDGLRIKTTHAWKRPMPWTRQPH